MDFTFFDSLLDGIMIVDQKRSVVYANTSICNILGLSQKRIIKKNVRDVLIFSLEAVEQIDTTLINNISTPFSEWELNPVDQERKRVQIATSPFNENLAMVSVHDVSLEESLQRKYRHELSQKEKYIEKLNRKIFELEFMLEIMSGAQAKDDDKNYPDLSLQKILNSLNIDFILLLSREDDLPSSKIEVATAFAPNSSLVSSFRDLTKTTLDYWRTVDLGKMGTESPIFIQDTGAYRIVTVLVRGKQNQWKIFLYHYAEPRFELANINKSLLASLSRQVHMMAENQTLFFLAVTDEKTQIYNTRYFSYRLQNELLRSKRYKHPVSLFVIDIDYFKKFNDTYGHLIGDFVLRQVAKSLKSTLRACDVVARFGGEEFVVYCPETNKEQGKIAAERSRRAIEELKLEVGDGQTTSVTVSIGVASYPSDGDDPTIILKHADEAVYLAKKQGRNRVEVYQA